MDTSKDLDVYSMSLDDIIKKKNIGRKDGNNRPKQQHGGINKKSNGLVTKKRLQSNAIGKRPSTNAGGRFDLRSNIVDAREMIRQRTRGKIRDARERLIQIGRGSHESDLYQARRYADYARYHQEPPMEMLRQRLPPQRHYDVIPRVPRGYVDYDNMAEEEAAERQGNYAAVHRPDVFDELCYQVPTRRPALPTTVTRPATVVVRDSSPSDDEMQRGYSPPRSRPVMVSKPESPRDPDGYRIVVSNLPADITAVEVELLFEDIGAVAEVRMARPGVAEVIYKHLKDAEKAVEYYDNRKLDNQPIKCLLVKPRSMKNVVLTPDTSKKYNVDIDVGAFHKALFSKR